MTTQNHSLILGLKHLNRKEFVPIHLIYVWGYRAKHVRNENQENTNISVEKMFKVYYTLARKIRNGTFFSVCIMLSKQRFLGRKTSHFKKKSCVWFTLLWSCKYLQRYVKNLCSFAFCGTRDLHRLPFKNKHAVQWGRTS